MGRGLGRKPQIGPQGRSASYSVWILCHPSPPCPKPTPKAVGVYLRGRNVHLHCSPNPPPIWDRPAPQARRPLVAHEARTGAARAVARIYAAPRAAGLSFCLLFFLYFLFLFLFRASGSPGWRGFPASILTNFQSILTNFQLHLTNFQVYLTNFQLTRP
jgi:hypothetical protein